jgi:hypothetical protein
MVAAYSRFIAAVMIPSRVTGDLLAGMWQLLLQGFGAVPRSLLWDNESGIGQRGCLADGVAGFCGVLGTRLIQTRPYDPETKGLVERANGYLGSSFLAGRQFVTAVRGGRAVIDGVIFHSDRGSTYTANDFMRLCRTLGVRQSMGRVGSCFDNAASEAFFSTLEHEVLSRHHFATKAQAREVITAWCYDFYNTRRRHSYAGLLPPVDYEKIATIRPEAA